jgi:SMODS-associating 2TM, beta-strand rich effector domain
MARPAGAVRLTAVAVGAAYAGVLYLTGVHLQAGWKQSLSYLPTAATLVVALWDVWLWRQPGLHRLARRPLLLGTWKAILSPTDESHIPPGGDRGPIEAYVVINQSYWSISVCQYTRESRSESRAGVWIGDGAGPNRRLTFTYANSPKQQFESRSRAHLGTTSLDIVGNCPPSLSGYYFTDRYTKGDIVLTLFDRGVAHSSFDSARAHCERH